MKRIVNNEFIDDHYNEIIEELNGIKEIINQVFEEKKEIANRF